MRTNKHNFKRMYVNGMCQMEGVNGMEMECVTFLMEKSFVFWLYIVSCFYTKLLDTKGRNHAEAI